MLIHLRKKKRDIYLTNFQIKQKTINNLNKLNKQINNTYNFIKIKEKMQVKSSLKDKMIMKRKEKELTWN